MGYFEVQSVGFVVSNWLSLGCGLLVLATAPRFSHEIKLQASIAFLDITRHASLLAADTYLCSIHGFYIFFSSHVYAILGALTAFNLIHRSPAEPKLVWIIPVFVIDFIPLSKFK
ncbi:hypothetical protein DSO57_1005889 [Entomophthora muscae]|uniref:Uncharacterized protein n=1 Tax=Entomophthora muscae TaxID=34485 RepID=A0ACC2RMK9_9FUNG|nr:hypothetical protein DSO57_1005889 [Entomophthora muscae]